MSENLEQKVLNERLDEARDFAIMVAINVKNPNYIPDLKKAIDYWKECSNKAYASWHGHTYTTDGVKNGVCK